MNDQDWIEHKGGPCPVAADANYDTKYRNGAIAKWPAGKGRLDSYWTHDGSESDIVAWCLASPPAEAGPVGEPPVGVSSRAITWDAAKMPRLARDMSVRERFVLDIYCAIRNKSGVIPSAAMGSAIDEAGCLLSALGEKGDE